jgi:hypothetical protein
MGGTAAFFFFYLLFKVGPDGRTGEEEATESTVEGDLAGAEIRVVRHDD